MPNWKSKVAIQAVLARVPFGEKVNHALQRLNKRAPVRKQEILGILPTLSSGIALIKKHVAVEGASVVEVGTGWLPLPTTLLHLCGAKRIVSFDHERHVRYSLIREMLDVFSANRDTLANALSLSVATLDERLDRLHGATDLVEFLALAGITYVAPGDATTTDLLDGEADLFYSYAVLEHVPEDVLNQLVVESKRILRSGGCFYAFIGLHDHYACFDKRISRVHFLQHPEWAWRLFVKNRISYHNRLRERDFIETVERQGARIMEINSVTDPEDVTRVKSMRLDERFLKFTPEECAVTSTEFVAKFP
ncbi:MAG: methyltransferase domain-containing protein [Vicinamibacterales bacterium]